MSRSQHTRQPPPLHPQTWAADTAGPPRATPRASQTGAASHPRPFPGASPLRVTVLMHCLLRVSHRRTVSSWEPESNTLPSVDTDRHVTWFLGTDMVTSSQERENGVPSAPTPVSTAPAPVPSEHLPAVLLRLEALLFLPGLWRPRGPLSHASPGPPRTPPGPRLPTPGSRGTHPSAEIHLEDGAVAAAAEHVVLG